MKLNYLYRNLKNGEVTLFLIVIFLAVTCASSAIFFTEGLRNSLENSSSVLLGGDRSLASPKPIPTEFIAKANALGLYSAQTLTFFSMLVHGEDLVLSSVKAVDPNYPLKGSLSGSYEPEGKDLSFSDIPEPGTVWLEPSLFPLLNARIGDTLQIGVASFKITRVLNYEPDRGSEGLSLAPRALMNLQDVASTKVIAPGSRQTYFLLLTGSDSALEQFGSYIEPKLKPSDDFTSSRNSSPLVKTLFDQGENYIRLILEINSILACLALFQVSQCFYQRQTRTVALLRCFGASFRWIYMRYSLLILILGGIAGILGYFLGFLIVWLGKGMFEKVLFQKIEINMLLPGFTAFAVILLLLFCFIILPLRGLHNITPMRILHPTPILNFTGLSKIAKFLKKILLYCFGNLGVTVRYGITNLVQNLFENMIQLFAFAFVIAAVLLLILIRGNLLENWRNQVPPDAPNYFVINLGREDVNRFQQTLDIARVNRMPLYPVVRGQLLSVNDETVLTTSSDVKSATNENKENNKNVRHMHRLLNLSQTSKLPQENKIIAGSWFQEQDQGRNIVSIEQGFANRMRIKLGDTLKFQFGENTLSAKVTSIRTVQWNSFSPNFFIIFPESTLDQYPGTYMTSFYLPSEQGHFLKRLVQDFPAINIIDVNVIMKLLLKNIDTLSFGLEYLFLFTLLMSFLVLLSGIYSSLDARRENAIILRALGAGNRMMREMIFSEFLLLGLASGLLALAIATGIYAWLVKSIFQLTFQYDWWIVVLGPILGVILISAGGWLGVRKIITVSPREILSSRS